MNKTNKYCWLNVIIVIAEKENLEKISIHIYDTLR